MPKTAAPPSVRIITLGCPKNLVDTEAMCGNLALDGFLMTNDEEEADITLINTCSFINAARKESEGEIRQALKWKRARRGRRVVVTGCLPQRDLPLARRKFPQVDLFVGLDDEPEIVRKVKALLNHQKPEEVRDQYGAPTYVYDAETPRLLLTSPHTTYIKIAEGCDHTCTYCAIPMIRGKQRSRSTESIVKEARGLIAQGVREINLIAQDSTRYGTDRQDGANIRDLLTQLDAIDGDFWMRILYAYPRTFPVDLIPQMAQSPHLVPYIDMPLQHIAPAMLKTMGRIMPADATRELMWKLREGVPGIAIRTTFIVGFPGETDADFEELYDFVREFRFERMGVFCYSPEEGTPALNLKSKPVPQAVSEARRDRLMQLQQEISLARNEGLVRTRMKVIVEGPTAPGQFVGRSYADAPDIDNLVHFTGPDDAYEKGFVEVEITGADPYDLFGNAV